MTRGRSGTLVVSNHYRTAFNFSAEVLDAARRTMRRLDNFRRRLSEVTRTGGGEGVTSQVDAAREEFVAYLDDDLTRRAR